MKKYLIFKNSTELIEKFRGKILISKAYQSDPELNYYVGDLIEVDDIDSAIGEIESRESDFTEAGKEYFLYAFQNSDLEQILKEQVYRPDYVRNFEDIMGYNFLAVPQRERAYLRAFNVMQSPQGILNIASHLGLGIDDLQPHEMRLYDHAYRELINVFNLLFNERNGLTGRNFCVGYNHHHENRFIYACLFKSHYLLKFNPSIYVQNTSDKKGGLLNNTRETVKVLFPLLQNTIIDYKQPRFLESGIELFQKVKEQIFKILEAPLNLSEFLRKHAIPYIVIPPGKLWNDVKKCSAL